MQVSTKTKTKTAVIYCRVSLDRDGEHLAVERQEAACRAYAEHHGYTISEVYVDNSVSALKRKRRPGYEAFLSAVEEGRVSTLIAWHPDRITRNTAELERLIKILDEHRVSILTTQAGTLDLTTATGRMTARIIGAVATAESELKAERMSAKHRQLAEGGKRNGGRRPFGYADYRCSAIVPAEAALIREAVARIMAGESLRAIGLEWSARGLTALEGGVWTASALGAVLRKASLCGLRSYRGELHAGKWEGILSVSEWERLQAVLRDRTRRARRPAVPYLLAGLAEACPSGILLTGNYQDGRRVYHSPHGQALEVDLDAIVTERLFEHLSSVNVAERLAATMAASDERGDVEAERERLQADRAALLALGRSGVLTPAELGEQLAPNTDALRNVEARLEAMEAATAGAGAKLTAMLADAPVALLRRAWDRATGLERRAFIRTVVERVYLLPRVGKAGKAARLKHHPERVVVWWKGERKPRLPRAARAA
jgi:site-specific DNA recombinase